MPSSLDMAEWFRWFEVTVCINQVWILCLISSTKVAGFTFSQKVFILCDVFAFSRNSYLHVVQSRLNAYMCFTLGKIGGTCELLGLAQ